MSWLLSIRHDECDPTTATGGANAPYRIINRSGLDSIVSELKERGSAADDQSCSIPKPTASIEYMRARIGEIDEHTNIADADNIDAAVNAWIGTLAVIVLSGRKNLSIVEKDILISSSDDDESSKLSYLKKAIYDDFSSLGFLEGDPASKTYLKLFSIGKQTTSYPIAIADRSCLIFSPINNVDPNVASSLSAFMKVEKRVEINNGNTIEYKECVWKNISDWDDFTEDDKLYLSSWIDGMLKSIGDMKCKKALKALNKYLKASVDDYIDSVVAFGADGKSSDNVLRWKSAWSYIALSKLFGDDLFLESIDTKAISSSPSVSRWLATTFNTDTYTSDFMHIVVKHKGNPIIKFYPEVGLYLYKNISNPQVWCRDQKYIDVFQADAAVVCADFKSDLMWYLTRVYGAFEPSSDTAKALNKWIESAKDQVAPTDAAALEKIGLVSKDLFDAQTISTPSVKKSLGLIENTANTYVNLFNEILTLGLPGVFNPNLVVFFDDQEDIKASETIRLKINDEASHIKAFWPITPEMAQYVVEHNATLSFNDVVGCLDNKIDNKDSSVIIKYNYSVESRTVLLSHEYKMTDICCLEGRVPYMTMWPYFLPSEPSYWEDYYVGLVNVVRPNIAAFERFEKNNKNLVELWQRITIPDIKFSPVSIEETKKPIGEVSKQSITSADKNEFSWQILKQKTFPRFVSLSGRLGGAAARTIDIGCVAIILPEKVRIEESTSATVGIDFGNSNTICAIAKSTDKQISYTIIDDSDTISLLNGDDDSGSYDSLSRCWVPKTSFERKFLTAVQLFNTTEILPTSNRGISNGVVLFDNVDAIIKLYGNARGNNVISALKAGLDADNVDDSVKSAASVFLSQTLLLCKLRARKLGCGKVYYHFSYPKSQSKAKSNLTDNLDELTDFVADSEDIGRISLYDEVFINEAEAVKEYLLSLKPEPSGLDGYALVDIGGGTTDFSVWQGQPDNIPTCHIESSLRFAGISILSDSIISDFPQGTKALKDLTTLKKTFAIEEDTKPAEWIKKYVDYTIPAGMMEADEKYLRLILDNIINKTNKVLPVPTEARSRDLRCHVHLKYLATFFAIAKSSSAKGKLPCPCSGSFNIYLAGGGSQCIDFASHSKGELNDLVAKMFRDYVFEGNTDDVLVTLVPPKEGMSKLEVATGLLNHYMDLDARRAAGHPVSSSSSKTSSAEVGPAEQTFTQADLKEMYEDFVTWCLENHEKDTLAYEETLHKLSLKDNAANETKFRTYCIPLAARLCHGTDDPYLFICKAVSIMLEP